MTVKLLTRFAAIFILVHLLGHSIGHISWKDENGPLFGVVKVMMSQKAEFMGAVRSIADYYGGYSLIMFGLYGMSSIILWILSNYCTEHKKMVKQLLYAIGLVYVFFGIVEFYHFFPFAAIVSLLAGLLTLTAAFELRKK